MKAAIHLITPTEEQLLAKSDLSKTKVDYLASTSGEFQKMRSELRLLQEELATCRREIHRQTVLLANARVREQELRVSLCR